MTVVFAALLGWFVLGAWRGGAVAWPERVVSSVQICWPFVVAVAVVRTTARDHRSPGLSAQAEDGSTQQFRVRARRCGLHVLKQHQATLVVVNWGSRAMLACSGVSSEMPWKS